MCPLQKKQSQLIGSLSQGCSALTGTRGAFSQGLSAFAAAAGGATGSFFQGWESSTAPGGSGGSGEFATLQAPTAASLAEAGALSLWMRVKKALGSPIASSH
jgi:hypothetical protein